MTFHARSKSTSNTHNAARTRHGATLSSSSSSKVFDDTSSGTSMAGSPTCVSMLNVPPDDVRSIMEEYNTTSLFHKPTKRESKKFLDDIMLLSSSNNTCSNNKDEEGEEEDDEKPAFLDDSRSRGQLSPLHLNHQLTAENDEEEELVFPDDLNLPSIAFAGEKRCRHPRLAPMNRRTEGQHMGHRYEKKARNLFDPDEIDQIVSSRTTTRMLSPRRSYCLMLPQVGISL